MLRLQADYQLGSLNAGSLDSIKRSLAGLSREQQQQLAERLLKAPGVGDYFKKQLDATGLPPLADQKNGPLLGERLLKALERLPAPAPDTSGTQRTQQSDTSGTVLDPSSRQPFPNGPEREIGKPTGGPQPFPDLPKGLTLPPAVEKLLSRTPEEERREKAMRAMAKVWERTVGPLDDNPALRKALMEMVTAGEEFKGADGSDLWQFLEQQAGRSDGFGDFLDGIDGSGDWKLPALDLPSLGKWDWGNWGGDHADGDPHGPRPASANGSSSSGFASLFGDTWLPVILLVALLLGVLLYWRFVYTKEGGSEAPTPPPGLGPWPVDPRF